MVFPVRSVVVGCVLGTAVVASAAPVVVPHAGLLLDASDVPVESSGLPVRFGVYSAAVGGNPLWVSQSCFVSVHGGRFSTTIGDACTGPAPLDETVIPPGSVRWIDFAIDGVTLTPRVRLSSVPSAAVALRSLDTEALRSKLASAGTLNATDNPVDWTQLKGVPVDVAAGGNYAAGAGLLLTGKQFSIPTGGIVDGMLAGMISGQKLAPGSVGTAQLADGSVTTSKIAAGAITGLQVADGSIGIEKIAGGIPLSVTTGTLDAARLTGSLPAGMVPTGTRMERSATRTTCAASDIGTLYLNSDDDQVYVCSASGWKKVSQRPGTLRWAETAWAIGNVYATAASRTITLHNDGDLAVSGLQITIPANLIQQSTTCGSSLAGASTCTVTVTTVHPGASTPITGNLVASGAGTTSALPVTGQFQPLSACKTIKTVKPAATNGIYTIDPDGAGAGAPYEVFCDMTSNGGGWTLAARMVSGSWCHINAATVGSLTSPGQGACAKLSDAQIRALYSDQFWLSCGTSNPDRFGRIDNINNFNTDVSVGNKTMTWSTTYNGSTYGGTDHSCCNLGDHNYAPSGQYVIYSIGLGYNNGNYTQDWSGCYNANHGWHQSGFLYVR